MKRKVIAALFTRNNEFMICRRPPHKARGGLFEFVGGKVEEGENDEQTLVRECREELGVSVAVGDEFMRVTHEYPDLTVELVVYLAKITEGTPQLLEHTEILWISPEEIDGYEFCPADESILARIKAEGLPEYR